MDWMYLFQEHHLLGFYTCQAQPHQYEPSETELTAERSSEQAKGTSPSITTLEECRNKDGCITRVGGLLNYAYSDQFGLSSEPPAHPNILRQAGLIQHVLSDTAAYGRGSASLCRAELAAPSVCKLCYLHMFSEMFSDIIRSNMCAATRIPPRTGKFHEQPVSDGVPRGTRSTVALVNRGTSGITACVWVCFIRCHCKGIAGSLGGILIPHRITLSEPTWI